uniref:Uncharacterized protein n=1 Tax=Meloidogyne enterolobii TaxID=390850 RepID=A0A6V7UWJ4_MELEN|nr:unnamed protein product [Meloidogyne enterolobii]
MVLNTFSLTYGFIFMIFGFNYALENPDMYVIKQEFPKLKLPYRKVYCNTPEQIGGDILSFGYYVSISVTLVTIFNYIIVGIIIKCMFN